MTPEHLHLRLRELCEEALPLPGGGASAARHERLFEVAREDLTLAKLAEAHWDAVSILAEAGRAPVAHALYAVWASEIQGKALTLVETEAGLELSGAKQFCSGIGIVDRALLTTGGPDPQLLDLDLRLNHDRIVPDLTSWQVQAFAATNTGGLRLNAATLQPGELIGAPRWYLTRPGFWNGACGPAACWAGGVAGLVDFAMASRRDDPHTLAHLAAMQSNLWAMTSLLRHAGAEMDADPGNRDAAQIRALQLRHLTEQLSTDILHRFARAYGPQPLAMNQDISRRYAEADLYLRQSHAERDLEGLARLLRSARPQ